MIDEIVLKLLFLNVLMNLNVLFFEFYFVLTTRNDDLLLKAVFIRKKGFHLLNVKKEKIMSTYNFQATVASGWYYVYKKTTWSNAKVEK